MTIYRKLMKLLTPFLILACVFFTQSVNAQTVVTIPTSTPVACDGIAYIDDSQSFTSWYWTDNTGNTIQNGLDTLYNLCEGTYILNYTNFLGPGADTFNIIENPCSSFLVNFIASTPSLGNQCNGELTLEIVNGTAPYICEIALLSDPLNPIILTLAGPNATITSLCSESYLVTVTDSNGCTGSFNATVPDACAGFSADVIAVQNATAPNVCDGSISVSASGGTPGYSYLWSNGVTTSSLTNLCAGSYILEVTDMIGCQDSISIPVTDPCSNLQLYFSAVAPNTNPINCNGIIFGQVSGGSAPYTYLWNTGVNADSLFFACAGSYSLTVTDANGCVFTGSFTVIDSITPLVITADLNIFDETASGLCNGSASVVNVAGGIAPYSYMHSDGTPLAEATDLCAGIYDVTIIDSTGNSLTLPYVIADPGNIIFNLPYPDSTIVDSLFNNAVANCDIDYNSVNAAYIYNASLAGFDSVTVTWVVYDSSGVNYITETYYFGGGNGVYSLSLSVYCPQKSVEQYLKVYDQLYLSEELGLVESALNNLLVYPNPFNESISIQFEKPGDYTLELLDVTGRKLLSHSVSAQSSAQLNGLNTLAQGEYLLYIHSGSESVIRNIVK